MPAIVRAIERDSMTARTHVRIGRSDLQCVHALCHGTSRGKCVCQFPNMDHSRRAANTACYPPFLVGIAELATVSGVDIILGNAIVHISPRVANERLPEHWILACNAVTLVTLYWFDFSVGTSDRQSIRSYHDTYERFNGVSPRGT